MRVGNTAAISLHAWGVKLVLERLKADTQDLTVLINMAQWTQVSVMRGELGSLN